MNDECMLVWGVNSNMKQGPHAEYTHWKQTVFYLNKVLPVSEGDNIVGSLACKPNSKNPRDLDIKIHYIFSGKSERVEESKVYILH